MRPILGFGKQSNETLIISGGESSGLRPPVKWVISLGHSIVQVGDSENSFVSTGRL